MANNDNTSANWGRIYPGRVLQLKTFYTGEQTATTSTSYVITTLSGTLTVANTANDIYVHVNGGMSGDTAGEFTSLELASGGGTEVYTGLVADGNEIGARAKIDTDINRDNQAVITYLYPVQTSSLVQNFMVRLKTTGGTGKFVSNTSIAAAMTLMEIER